MHEPYVPASVLKKYICMWLAEDTERTQDSVEARTGISVRTIGDIMRGRRETVWFDTADTILIRLGYYDAWWKDEQLAHIYAAA